MTELRQAAQAVLDRWDSPQWAWRQHGPTADLMADLRAALAQPPAPHRYSPLGMASCGKPLCSDREHHPLCQMAQPPAPTAQPAATKVLIERLHARTESPPCNADGTYTVGNCPPDALCREAAAEIERLRADAARYRWLRNLRCNSVSVSRDDDHACNYMTASEWIDDNADWYVDDNPEEVQRMRDTNTIWRLQVYPNTPVGFNVWNGSTLDSAIDAAMRDAL